MLHRLFSITLLALTLLLAGCSEGENKNNTPISLLYPDGIEALAITHLTQTILEENGYNVTLKNVEQGPLFSSLAQGGGDLFMDAWLPHTQKSYWDKYGEQIDSLGTVLSHARTGLVVPTYVRINSIEELNANRALFGGKIYGVGPGAGIHANTLKAIDAYQLDFEQITSTESAMLTTLKRATLKKEPIVITGWTPHSKWNQYDLKMLNDPKEIYLVDRIDILARQGFREEYPEVANFLQHFQLTNEQFSELIDLIAQDIRTPSLGAKAFYEKYALQFGSI